MTPFDLFLGTLAIGAGFASCLFFVLAACVMAYRLADLLDNTIAALRRYAVREWHSPKWEHVQIFKRNAKKEGR